MHSEQKIITLNGTLQGWVNIAKHKFSGRRKMNLCNFRPDRTGPDRTRRSTRPVYISGLAWSKAFWHVAYKKKWTVESLS